MSSLQSYCLFILKQHSKLDLKSRGGIPQGPIIRPLTFSSLFCRKHFKKKKENAANTQTVAEFHVLNVFIKIILFTKMLLILGLFMNMTPYLSIGENFTPSSWLNG